MSTVRILPNLSEKIYRYFEPHLHLAVNNWPRETAYDLALIPPDERYAPATFVGRFRDAIVSLKRFGWETYVNHDKLFGEDMAGKFVIALDTDGKIYFRHKQRPGRPTYAGIGEAVDRGEKPSHEGVVLWKDITGKELEALAVLISGKRIDGPVLVEGNVPLVFADDVKHYEMSLDVSFTWDEKRGVTVVL